MNKLIIVLIAISAMSCHPFFRFFKGAFRGRHSEGHRERHHHNRHVSMPSFEEFGNRSHFVNKIMGGDSSSLFVVSKQTMITEEPRVHSKYDKCLDLVEVVAKNTVEMAKMCMNGDWRATIPVFIDTSAAAAHAVECFIDAGVKKVSTSLELDPQCVIEHLTEVQNDFTVVVKDILHRDWQKAEADFQTIVDTLNDIKNC